MTAGAGGGGSERDAIVAAWLRRWAAHVHERREWLTELDAAIGDGDHGINLDRGLVAVVAELDAGALGPRATARGPGGDGATDGRLAAGATDGALVARTTDGRLLADAGRRLLNVVGGASGALYGRALLRAGDAIEGLADPDALPRTALAAIVDAVQGLGRATAGDKTMVDALLPSVAVITPGIPGEGARVAARRAAEAAEAGAAATADLVARKGRASYLGERSAGHLDPGAASAALLVRSLAEAYEDP